MEVRLNKVTVVEEQWDENIETLNQGGGTIYPIVYTLEGSGVNLEMLYSDEHLFFHFRVQEDDNLVKDIAKVIFDSIVNLGIEFDTSAMAFLDTIHPKYYTGSKEFIMNYPLQDGMVSIILATEMNLIVLLDQGHVFFA